jgi:hypothetical protein
MVNGVSKLSLDSKFRSKCNLGTSHSCSKGTPKTMKTNVGCVSRTISCKDYFGA